jgi:hypothetical protein
MLTRRQQAVSRQSNRVRFNPRTRITPTVGPLFLSKRTQFPLPTIATSPCPAYNYRRRPNLSKLGSFWVRFGFVYRRFPVFPLPLGERLVQTGIIVYRIDWEDGLHILSARRIRRWHGERQRQWISVCSSIGDWLSGEYTKTGLCIAGAPPRRGGRWGELFHSTDDSSPDREVEFDGTGEQKKGGHTVRPL